MSFGVSMAIYGAFLRSITAVFPHNPTPSMPPCSRMLEIVQGCNAMFKNVQELERFPVKCRGIMWNFSNPPIGESEFLSCLFIRVCGVSSSLIFYVYFVYIEREWQFAPHCPSFPWITTMAMNPEESIEHLCRFLCIPNQPPLQRVSMYSMLFPTYP